MCRCVNFDVSRESNLGRGVNVNVIQQVELVFPSSDIEYNLIHVHPLKYSYHLLWISMIYYKQFKAKLNDNDTDIPW